MTWHNISGKFDVYFVENLIICNKGIDKINAHAIFKPHLKYYFYSVATLFFLSGVHRNKLSSHPTALHERTHRTLCPLDWIGAAASSSLKYVA